MLFARLSQLFLNRLLRTPSPISQRSTTRFIPRLPALETLESRQLLSAPTLSRFITQEHVDLDISYNSAAQNFELRVQDSDNGVTHETAEGLIYVGAKALVTRPTGSQFDFLGVAAGQPLYVLPSSQNVSLPYLGFASYSTTSTDIDQYSVTTESKSRRSGSARWLKLTLVDVDHFQPDGSVGTGRFSAWQSNLTGPVVYMANHNDSIANPNANGLDVTDGISADDALWVTRGGHDHYNLGFTQVGRYEISFRVSAYVGTNGNSTTPNTAGYRESGILTTYFSVLNLGQIEFDQSTYTVNEGAQSATIVARRVNGSDGQLTVDLVSADLTATAPSDYSALSTTLTFLDKQTTQTISVAINHDTLVEADESLSLSLSNPGPANIADYVASPDYDNSSLLGTTATSYLTIVDNDGSAAPTDITLSSSTLAENLPTGSTVGTFTTSDPDVSDSFTYSLVAGTGDTGNAAFEIVDNQLRTTDSFNFEAQSSYSIRVRSTDSSSLSTDKVFTITVSDVNESPTNLTLSSSTLAENLPTGSTVGTFTTSDPDVSDSFTYSLVAGTGDTGNAAFELVDNQLRTTSSFNFEAQSSYSIRVRSTDSGSLSTDKVFTITVSDVNEAPTEISLSSSSIPENAAIGSVVGTLSSQDPDGPSTFAYALADGAGDSGNSAFEIVGDELRTRIRFDHDAQSTYSIRIQSTDGGQASFQKPFTISIAPYSLPPVISATSGTLTYTENAAPAVILPSSSVSDPDSTNYAGGLLSVVIASGSQAEDRLGIRNVGSGPGQIGVSGQTVTFAGVAIGEFLGGGTGDVPLAITLNASANAAATTALVRAITFRTETENPVAAPRTVRFVLTDGDGGTSLPRDREVRVTPVNDRPTLDAGAGQAEYVENETATLIAPALTIADSDSLNFDTGKLTVTISAGAATTDRLSILPQGTAPGEVDLDGGNLRFGGVVVGTFAGGFTTNRALTITFNAEATPAIAQAVARRIGFHNAGDHPTAATRSVSFALTDGDGGKALPSSRPLAVTTANDPSVISTTSGVLTYVENATPAPIFTASTVSDPDSANFDAGVLHVGFLSGSQPTDRLRIRHVGTATRQIGVDGQSVTWAGVEIGTFTGGWTDSSDLVITLNANATPVATTALLKAVTFSTDTDHPVASARVVRAWLSDGDGGTSAASDREVRVTPVNDRPTLDAGAGPAEYQKGATATLVAPALTIADSDSPNFDTGKLTVTISAGAATTDRLSILPQGTAPGEVDLDGGNLRFGGVVVGTFAGGFTTNRALTITFNAEATPAIAQAVARRIGFHNVVSNPATTARTLSFALTDGDGGTAVTSTRQLFVI
jgi:surface-anchored protein